ncbi:hybrid sensor histidine kinase/response regulator [Aphanothece hegewaldii CCALA 016]|uniref:histidine kinase n=1 Tax=Aphanothece hegewaldii CCALA 016 TaxID=2107694 RepID=A0A2T1LUP2_9CHRO|nr:hybrid sensor histidine kinase/response regulator [Aphanothece hegewaldii]PSF35282.1 hybrid sensor histidine kinase/response regulator [Aphanothece hegewaldii CCALA 016]
MSENNLNLTNFSMLELFNIELDNQTEILNDNLLNLENYLKKNQLYSTSEIIPLLESLMRAAHSIKGAARIVEIDEVVKLAHLMEDYFSATISQNIIPQTQHIDQILEGVDLLQKINQEENLKLWITKNQDNFDQIKSNISHLLENQVNELLTPLITEKNNENFSENNEQKPLNLDDVFPDEEEDLESESPTQGDLYIYQQSEELSNLENSTFLNSQISTFKTSEIFTNQAAPEKDRYIRVSSDNLNRLMGLAGEALVEATALGPFTDSLMTLKKSQLELSKLLENLQYTLLIKCALNKETENYLKIIKQKERECREILNDRLNTLEQFTYRSINLSDRLYREVINSHMRPFADGIQGFPRMVRDIAKQLNKSVKLEIIGKSTPVDRDILAKLEVPLTHLLRNSIAHGIEAPDIRIQKGKTIEGIIRLEAAHRFGMLSINVSDDGAGIDLNQLKNRILEKKLVTPEMAQQLFETELIEFIFLPGFTTANEVTEISGRGVGLNIAKTMVEEVGGNIQAISKTDKGMSFHFQLPLTLSVIRTLLVEISGEAYAFPLTRIEQAVRVNMNEIFYAENKQYFTLNGKNIGLVRADQVLELPPSKFSSDSFSIVIVSDQHNCYGLIVDRFLGEKNLVIRPLDHRLGKVQDISAAALLEDGSPVLILDVLDIIHSVDKILTTSYLAQANYEPELSWTQLTFKILVVDDSITVRETEKKLLQNYGYQVDLAVDGIEAWNMIICGKYDLIISDVDMPRMNGIKLVQQIKNHPLFKETPVIIISYKDREEDRLQGLEAGADYYLTKESFQDDTLIKVVKELLEK